MKQRQRKRVLMARMADDKFLPWLAELMFNPGKGHSWLRRHRNF